MKKAKSGSRGVYWRANVTGTQDLRRAGAERERGDWWIRWTCPLGHLHREHVGAKSLATKRAEAKRQERPCPRQRVRPAHYLLADVITEYLAVSKVSKLSHKDDA